MNDGDEFSCACSGENIRRRGGSWSCMLANVGTRHRFQVGPGSGFEQPLALMNECLLRFKERLSSWKLRQIPRFSRRTERAEGERRPFQRDGSSVLNEARTAKTSP